MWDITVDGVHDFFVDAGAVLVHNNTVGPCPTNGAGRSVWWQENSSAISDLHYTLLKNMTASTALGDPWMGALPSGAGTVLGAALGGTAIGATVVAIFSGASAPAGYSPDKPSVPADPRGYPWMQPR